MGIHLIRSLLFVSGDKPENFAKALKTEADAVCFDLEDAVSNVHKDEARKYVIDFLRQLDPVSCKIFVRINSLSSQAARDDLLALNSVEKLLTGLLLPKISSVDVLNQIHNIQENNFLFIPLIEDALGLRLAHEIAAHQKVIALAFGSVDMTTSVGMTASTETLLPIRSALVMAAAEACKTVIDGPCIDISNMDELAADALSAQRLGFTGKIAIHPNQINVVNSAFTPSAEQIVYDKRVIEATSLATEGVITVDNRMVDKPIIDAAKRRLALVESLKIK